MILIIMHWCKKRIVFDHRPTHPNVKMQSKICVSILSATMILASSSAQALKPPEDFGIKLVPPFMAEKVVADCEYLGEVATRSYWGGLVAGSLGKKGVMKRLYKKAHRLDATHLVLVESAETAYSGFTEGSAHAFDCGKADVDPGGYSAGEAAKLRTAQENAEQTASLEVESSNPPLRAVNEDAAKNCAFIKTVMKGAGGSADPSIYVEQAMEKALVEAANAGADSYVMVNLDTTASGASVVLEALKCKSSE
ncbi:hypothetical protein ACFL07_01330 [Pseudomonadota bacterium]